MMVIQVNNNYIVNDLLYLEKGREKEGEIEGEISLILSFVLVP